MSFNPGVNILVSVGAAAGQRFPHLVVPIIPRKDKDEVNFSWKGKPIPENELEPLREKIVAGMKKTPLAQEVVPSNPEDVKKKMMSSERRLP